MLCVLRTHILTQERTNMGRIQFTMFHLVRHDNLSLFERISILEQVERDGFECGPNS